jgi:hypothetical protein
MAYYQQSKPSVKYRHLVVEVTGIDTVLHIAHLYTAIPANIRQVQSMSGTITVDASVDWELVCFHHNVIFIMYHNL